MQESGRLWLDGRVIVVTGGASGIGLGTARVLASRGASVVIADINGPAAEAAAAAIAEQGGTALGLAADVSREADVQRMIAAAVETYGGLDGLHNNAALLDPAVLAQDVAIVDIDPDVFSRVLSVNLVGYALGAKHAIPRMIERGGGVIVNTGSVTGILAELGRAMYASSKAAVIGFTRNLATQHGKDRIRSVSISPGVIETPALLKGIPKTERARLLRHGLLPYFGAPEDIGCLSAFLMSDEARFITGIDIPVDGGLTAHWPTVADERDAR